MSELNIDFHVSAVDDECWINRDCNLYIMADNPEDAKAMVEIIDKLRCDSNQLTTITKQRDELQKYLRHIHDYMLVKNKSYREGDLSAEVGTLLSTIKEQKDAE